MNVAGDAGPLPLHGALDFESPQLFSYLALFHVTSESGNPLTSPAPAKPMNHQVCQKCGRMVSDRLATVSLQRPSPLWATAPNR